MKRFIAILLFILVGFSSLSYATPSVDVKSMSDAELEGLRDLVNDELDKRSDNTVSSDYEKWYEYGLGQYLPSPTDVFGREPAYSRDNQVNTDDLFTEIIDDVSDEEFDKYCDAAMAYNFTVDVEKTQWTFSAISENGRFMLNIVRTGSKTEPRTIFRMSRPI